MLLQDTPFEPVESPRGWLVATGVVGEAEHIEAAALDLLGEALGKGYYCICGALPDETEGHRLYLVPARGVNEVIRAFAVGSLDGDDPERLIVEIAPLDGRNPLIPYFVNQANFLAKFSQPLTAEFVSFAETQEVFVYGEPMMDDEDGTVTQYLLENNGIHLWWD